MRQLTNELDTFLFLDDFTIEKQLDSQNLKDECLWYSQAYFNIIIYQNEGM